MKSTTNGNRIGLWLVSMALCCAPGCLPSSSSGGGSGGGSSAGGGPLGGGSTRGSEALRLRVDDWVEAACERGVRCQPYQFPGLEDCRVLLTLDLKSYLQTIRQYEEDGTVTVSPNRLDACLRDTRELPCSAGMSSACQEVFQGRLPVGADCRRDLECEDGDCQFGQDDCGTCAATLDEDELPLREVGESCEELDCRPDLYCASNDGEDGECVTVEDHFTAGPGAACNLVAQDCRPDLVCARQTDEDGRDAYVCVTPGSTGDRCFYTSRGFVRTRGSCSRGHSCVESVEGFDGVCVPLLAEGAACERDSAVPDCALGARCISGECRGAKFAGDPCSLVGECVGSRCIDGICVSESLRQCVGDAVEESGPRGPGCQPGDRVLCMCDNGRSTRVCGEDGYYGECRCSDGGE